jgi:hypothetical protein
MGGSQILILGFLMVVLELVDESINSIINFVFNGLIRFKPTSLLVGGLWMKCG